MDSCSSPRPTTFTVSGLSVFSRRIDTLPISSRSSRSRTCRDVTYCPSRPATGDVLTPKIIDTVGSSTAIIGTGICRSTSVTVSPMVMSAMPARQTMSPAAALSMSMRFSPSNEYSFVTFALRASDVGVQMAISSPIFTLPLKMRPMAMRPR